LEMVPAEIKGLPIQRFCPARVTDVFINRPGQNRIFRPGPAEALCFPEETTDSVIILQTAQYTDRQPDKITSLFAPAFLIQVHLFHPLSAIIYLQQKSAAESGQPPWLHGRGRPSV
jgi:hypothetical protein